MTLEGKAALEFQQRLRQEQQEKRERSLAVSRTEANRTGKESFNFEEVQRLITNPRWTAAELEFAYYVERPDLATLEDFAVYIKQMDRWDRG